VGDIRKRKGRLRTPKAVSAVVTRGGKRFTDHQRHDPRGDGIKAEVPPRKRTIKMNRWKGPIKKKLQDEQAKCEKKRGIKVSAKAFKRRGENIRPCKKEKRVNEKQKFQH